MNNQLSQFVTGDYCKQEINLTGLLSTPEFLAQIRAQEATIRASISMDEVQPCGVCFDQCGLHILMPTRASADQAYKDLLKRVDVINVRMSPNCIVSCSFPNTTTELNEQSFNIILGSIYAQAIYGVLRLKASTYEDLEKQASVTRTRKIVL